MSFWDNPTKHRGSSLEELLKRLEEYRAATPEEQMHIRTEAPMPFVVHPDVYDHWQRQGVLHLLPHAVREGELRKPPKPVPRWLRRRRMTDPEEDEREG